jgi:hypothetical protein
MPSQLQALINSVAVGYSLHFFIRAIHDPQAQTKRD